SKAEWQGIFRQLVALGLLSVDMTEHGGLKITAQGQAFLRAKTTVLLRRDTAKKKADTRRALRAEVDNAFEDMADRELYAALKSARLEMARAQDVPPYVIFHDRTLRDMAVFRPKTLSD